MSWMLDKLAPQSIAEVIDANTETVDTLLIMPGINLPAKTVVQSLVSVVHALMIFQDRSDFSLLELGNRDNSHIQSNALSSPPVWSSLGGKCRRELGRFWVRPALIQYENNVHTSNSLSGAPPLNTLAVENKSLLAGFCSSWSASLCSGGPTADSGCLWRMSPE